jgi:hypothetical protein
MPESAVRTFSDPDDYAASINKSSTEVTVIGLGQFTAKLTRIDLHRLWSQRFAETVPRIVRCASRPGWAGVTFLTRPGPRLLWSGVEMHPSNIRLHAPDEDAFQQTSGPASFAACRCPLRNGLASRLRSADATWRYPRTR